MSNHYVVSQKISIPLRISNAAWPFYAGMNINKCVKLCVKIPSVAQEMAINFREYVFTAPYIVDDLMEIRW